jgi:hypothetical protein
VSKILELADLTAGGIYMVDGTEAKYYGRHDYGRGDCEFYAPLPTGAERRFLVKPEEIGWRVRRPDTLDKTMTDIRKAVEEKTARAEHPAAHLMRFGYTCERMGNGGWLVRPTGRMYDPVELGTMSAFSNWQEMMAWLREGHESVAPSPEGKAERMDAMRKILMGGPERTTTDTRTSPVFDAMMQEQAAGQGSDWIERDARGRWLVPSRGKVQIRLRNGVVLNNRDAENEDWNGASPMERPDDIVAYRLI